MTLASLYPPGLISLGPNNSQDTGRVTTLLLSYSGVTGLDGIKVCPSKSPKKKKTETSLINNLKDFISNIKGFQKGGNDRTYYKNI